jgi:hypothetical protein
VFGPVLCGSLIFQIAADSGYFKRPSKKLWFHERTGDSVLVLQFQKNNSGWELGGSWVGVFQRMKEPPVPVISKTLKNWIFSENQAG